MKQIYKTKTGIEIGCMYEQPQFNLAMSRDAEKLQRVLIKAKREVAIRTSGQRDYSMADTAWLCTLGLSAIGLIVVWLLK